MTGISLDENLQDVKEGSEEVLQEYIQEVLGRKVSTANLTPKQQRGLTKLMILDEIYFKPISEMDTVRNLTNIPRKIAEIVVEASKGKEGYGIEAMQKIFRERYEEQEKEDSIGDRIRRRV
jgi:hypothetical protein